MTPFADQGYHEGSAQYRRVAVALFAAGISTFALLYSTQAVLPELADRFDVSSTRSTLALSVTTIGLGVALLAAGPASERLGRTPLIHASLTASAVVAAGCALAPTWPALLALRLLEGIALAGLPAVATAYLREELHPAIHARAAGLYIGGTALGGMSGRLLTGGVAEVAGWRWALGSAALLGFGCAVAVRILLPPSRHFNPARPGRRGPFGMIRRALSDPGLLCLYGIGACIVGAFIAVFNTLGFRLTGAPFNLGVGAASLVYAVYPCGAVGSTLAGRLADRVGRGPVVPLGCLLALAGVLLTVPVSLPALITGLALLTAGFFVVHGVASGWVPAQAQARRTATSQAASLYLFAFYLASSGFGSLAGGLWSATGWSGVVWLATALVAAAGLLSIVPIRSHGLDQEPRPRASRGV